MEFIIRQAKITDIEDIYNINKISLGYDYDLEKQKNKLKLILEDSTQVVFVAEKDNKIVGYVHLANYNIIYMDSFINCLALAVDNDYKRNGIGSALIKQAEIWAKENGAVGIRLCSSIEREKAHEFYLSQGFFVSKLQKNFKKVF